MIDRDARYRQQRDRYREALIDVAAAAVVGGVTAALDFLPPDRQIHSDVQVRAGTLRKEMERLARQRA